MSETEVRRGDANSIRRALEAGEELRATISGEHPWGGFSGVVMSEFPPFKDWFVVLLDNGQECGAPVHQMEVAHVR